MSLLPAILLRSGNYFNFLEPEKSTVTIHDISHALSQICRFTGHCRTFYSVAQHCVETSWLVPSEHAFAALMHDAHEALLGDISSTLKILLPDFKRLEKVIEPIVLAKWGLTLPLHPCVKEADLIMLARERHYLMPPTEYQWSLIEGIDIGPYPPLRAWSAKEADIEFMERFRMFFTEYES